MDWFVGRRRELATFIERLDRAATGSLQVYPVLGAAGVGKSALLSAVCEGAATRGVSVYRSRGFEGTDLPPLAVHSAWVREVILALREQNASAARDIETAEASGLALVAPAYVSAEAEHRALDLAYHEQQAAISSLALRLLRANDRTAVVVIDDLHVADEESVSALTRFADRARTLPLVIVSALRPVERADINSLLQFWDAERLGSAVHLHAFSDEEIAEYAARYDRSETSDATDARVLHLRESTEGHPLLLRWVLQESTESVELFVRSRVNALSERARELLLTLALYGLDFGRELVAALSTELGYHDALEEELQALCGAMLVVERGAGQFALVHDLVRQDVVKRIDGATTRRLHGVIGRGISNSAILAREDRDIIASDHLLQSGNESDVRAGLNYAFAAARNAERRGAWKSALAIWKRADSVGEEITDTLTRADIRLGMARAALFIPASYPDRYEAIPNLHRAIRTYIDFRDVERLASAARLQRSTLEPKYAEIFERALSIVPIDHPQRAVIEYRTGTCMVWLNKLDDFKGLIIQANARAKKSGPEWVELYTLVEIAGIHLAEGDPGRCLEVCNEVETRSAGTGDPWLLFGPLVHRNRALFRLGELEKSEQVARQALRVLETTRGLDTNFAYMAFTDIQRCALARGDWAEVVKYDSFETAVTFTPIVEALCETGRFDEADGYLERLIPGISHDPTGWVVVALYCTYCVGVRSRTAGDRKYVRQAVDWAHSLPTDILEYPFFYSVLGVALARIGFTTRDRGILAEAAGLVARVRRSGLRVQIAEIAEHEVAEADGLIHLEFGRFNQAARCLEEALSWAKHYKDRPREAWILFELSLVYRELERDAERPAHRALRIAGELQMVSLARRIGEGPVDADRLRRLTPREREVLSLVANGMANKEIAANLGISVYTAGNHVRHIMEKLGCANRAEAAVLGREDGP